MNDKFKDIYRIPTARAVWWDYSHTGLYFVTICTHGMKCCLGKMASISPPKGSLGSVIRSYKSAVSGQVHILHPQFGWQERYYDNIIKDVPAYQRIETYIRNNVRNWENDILFGK